MDTLKDVVEWIEISTNAKKELSLGNCGWLKRYLDMRLFKIGRFNFCIGGAECDIPEFGVKKGDNIIEIHIPTEGLFKKCVCEESLDMAREFFAKYFPEYHYEYFTCNSWLLDKTLRDMLDAGSNIIEFQNMFTMISETEADSAITSVFSDDMTRRKLKQEAAATSLAQKIKDHALNGGKFYETYGIIKK